MTKSHSLMREPDYQIRMGGLEQKIKELQKQLTEQKKLVRFWEAAMEIIEDEFKVDVKKKYLTEYQRNELRKIENRSKK